MAFSDRLKERRIAKGYTQVQLSKLLGLANGAVGNYEAGQNSPRAEVLYKMFAILDCDANFLLQDEMEEQQKKAPSESANEITKNEPLELTVARPGDSRLQSIIDCYNSISRDGKERLLEQATMYANNPKYQKVNTDNRVSNYVIIANDGTKLVGTIKGDLIDEVKHHPSGKPDL